MKANKISVLFAAFAIVTSIIGVTYAHWTELISITGTANMGVQRVEIKCYKCGTFDCLCIKHSTVTCVLSEDKQTLNVEWKNVRPHSKLWLILVIENTGTIPVNVEPPSILFNPEEMHEYFKVYTIFFGPFDHLPQIPRDESSNPPDCWNFCRPPRLPVQLDPNQKLIMASCIKFTATCCDFYRLRGTTAEIKITLNYNQWNLS